MTVPPHSPPGQLVTVCVEVVQYVYVLVLPCSVVVSVTGQTVAKLQVSVHAMSEWSLAEELDRRARDRI